MVKAIVQAFRWREMLENGTHATIAEIAAAEKINETYVGRVLRLTLLAPDIVEAILGGRQPAEVTLAGVDAAVCGGVAGAAEDMLGRL
jgi:DNA-binding IscR family transcriptional regulator